MFRSRVKRSNHPNISNVRLLSSWYTFGSMTWNIGIFLAKEGHRAWIISTSQVLPARSFRLGDQEIAVMEDTPGTPSLLVASSQRSLCARPPPGWTVAPLPATQDFPVLPEVKSRHEQLEEKTTARVEELESKVTQLAAAVEQQAASSTQMHQQLEAQVTAVEAKIPDSAMLEQKFRTLLTRFVASTDKRLLPWTPWCNMDSRMRLWSLRADGEWSPSQLACKLPGTGLLPYLSKYVWITPMNSLPMTFSKLSCNFQVTTQESTNGSPQGRLTSSWSTSPKLRMPWFSSNGTPNVYPRHPWKRISDFGLRRQRITCAISAPSKVSPPPIHRTSVV